MALILSISGVVYGAFRGASYELKKFGVLSDTNPASAIVDQSPETAEQHAYRLTEGLVARSSRLERFLAPVLGQVAQRGMIFEKSFELEKKSAPKPQLTPVLATDSITTGTIPGANEEKSAEGVDPSKTADAQNLSEKSLESDPDALDQDRNLASLNDSGSPLSWANQPSTPFTPRPQIAAPFFPHQPPSFLPGYQTSQQVSALALQFENGSSVQAFFSSVGALLEMQLFTDAPEVRIVDCRVKSLNLAQTSGAFIPSNTPCESLTSIQDTGVIGRAQIDSIAKILRWRPTLKHRGLFEFTFIASNGLSYSNVATALVNLSLGGDSQELSGYNALQKYWDAEIAERITLSPQAVPVLRPPSIGVLQWFSFGISEVSPFFAQILGVSQEIPWRGEVASISDPSRLYLPVQGAATQRLHLGLPAQNISHLQESNFFMGAWFKPLPMGAGSSTLVKLQDVVPGMVFQMNRVVEGSDSRIEWTWETIESMTLGALNYPAPVLDYFAPNVAALNPEDPSSFGHRPSLDLNGVRQENIALSNDVMMRDRFTLSLWVNPRAPGLAGGTRETLLSSQVGLSSILNIEYDSGLREFVFNPGVILGASNPSSRSLRTGRGSAVNLRWYHLTLVREGLTLRVFLDGVLRDSNSFVALATPRPPETPTMTLGKTVQGFEGLIHRVQIFDDTLTQDQVVQAAKRIEQGKCILPFGEAQAALWNQWSVLLTPTNQASRIFWNGKPLCDLAPKGGMTTASTNPTARRSDASLDFSNQEISFFKRAWLSVPTTASFSERDLKIQSIGNSVGRDFLQNLLRFHGETQDMIPLEFDPSLQVYLDAAKSRAAGHPKIWVNLASKPKLAHAVLESPAGQAFPAKHIPFRITSNHGDPLLAARQDFTIMGWWKFDEQAFSAGTDVNQQIMVDADPEGNGTGVLLTRRGRDSRLEAWIGLEHILTPSLGLTSSTPTGWHHVALVRTNDTTTIYFDGVPVVSGRAGVVEEVPFLTVGVSRPPLTNLPFRGEVKSLKIFSRSLTTTQIQKEILSHH